MGDAHNHRGDRPHASYLTRPIGFPVLVTPSVTVVPVGPFSTDNTGTGISTSPFYLFMVTRFSLS